MMQIKELKKKIIEIEDDSDFSEKFNLMRSFKEIFDSKNNYNEKIKLYQNKSVLRNLSKKFGYFFEYWFYPQYLKEEDKSYLLEQIYYDQEINAYPSNYKYFIKNRIHDINEKIIYILVILYIKDIKNWLPMIDIKELNKILSENYFVRYLLKNFSNCIDQWSFFVNRKKIKYILNNDDELVKFLLKNRIEYIKNWIQYVESIKIKEFFSEENFLKFLIKHHIDKIDIWNEFVTLDLKKVISRKIGKYLIDNATEYIEKFIPYFREPVFRRTIPFIVYKAIKKGNIDMKNFEKLWKKYPEKRKYYIKLIEKYCKIDLSDYIDSMNKIDSIRGV